MNGVRDDPAIDAIDALDRNERINPKNDPETFPW
jgi:hypothetical protein